MSEQTKKVLPLMEDRIKNLEDRVSYLEHLASKQYPVPEWPPLTTPPVKEKVLTKKAFNWQRFELNIGTYLLQIAGVVIVLLGMGFLLKYSIERGWGGPLTRVIFGATVATIAIGAGEYLKSRYHQWALACSAGGIVLYYLSSYAAYAFYHLVSLETVFVFFCTITVGAVFLALRHNSLFVAMFSLIGGFLTPALLGIYDKNPPLVMGYLVLLAAGYLFLSYRKQWFSLSYLSFALMVWSLGSFVVSLDEKLLFFGAFWVVYGLAPYCYLFFKPINRRFEPLLMAMSTLFLFWELWSSLTSYAILTKFSLVAWLFAEIVSKTVFNHLSIVFALVYAMLLIGMFLRSRKNSFMLGVLYAITVLSCVGFIITQWNTYHCCSALYLFGLFLYALSFICAAWPMRIASYGIWGASSWYLISLVTLRVLQETSSLFFNEINGAFSVALVSFVAATWLSTRYASLLSSYEDTSSNILKICAALVPVVWMHTGLWKFPYYIIGIAVYSLIIFIIGLYRNDTALRMVSYGACLLSIGYFSFKYFFENLLNPHWVLDLNILFFTFIIIFIVAIFLIQLFRSLFEDKEFDLLKMCLDFLLTFGIFAWIRTNIILQFDVLENYGGPSIMQRLMGYSVQQDVLVRTGITNAALGLFYTIYAVLLIAYGLVKNNRIIRYVGLCIIALAFILLFEIIWQMPHTVQRIVTFLLAGGLLIGVSFLYQNMRKNVS